MPMKVPAQQEREIVTAVITSPLTLKLYSNDKTPAAGDVAGDYTEVGGGGYTSRALLFASWTLTAVGASPCVANYPLQTWNFTAPTNLPGTIYGYYVIRDSDSKLMWAERFPAGSLPFSPIVGSKIIVLPRYTGQSLF